MNFPRVIPTLLLRGRGLYKTVKFKNPVYIGDPMNTVRLFNEKEANEIVVLDIGATVENRGPNFEFLEDLASECFMPFAYGGGITTVDQIKRLFFLGAEKAVINTAAFDRPRLIEDAARQFGAVCFQHGFDQHTAHAPGTADNSDIHSPILAARWPMHFWQMALFQVRRAIYGPRQPIGTGKFLKDL